MTKAPVAKTPSTAATPLREPTDAERLAMNQAAEKTARMSRRRMAAPRLAKHAQAPGVVSVANPHQDGAGWSAHMLATLGTTSAVFADRLSAQLANASNPGPDGYIEALEHGLAFMAGVDPQSEVEAALGAQMFAVHMATMECARRAAKADVIQQLEVNGSLMVKLARTFTAQAEALAKLRSGGKQQVEVRYVYVDARGSQNVIAPGTAGGGGAGSGGQPHGPAQLALAAAAGGLPLWGADPGGFGVHGSGDPRAPPMPDARREEPGGANGAGEWGVDGRSLQPRAAGEPEGAPGAGGAQQGNAS